MPYYLAPASLLVFVATAALLDLRTRRIPNWLNAAALLVAIAVNVAAAGERGLLASGTGLLTGALIFLPFYVAGGFGAGDVKAMGTVGAFVGPGAALAAAAWILVIGGLCAAVVVAARRWKDSSSDVGRSASTRREQFPYGVAIALGTALSVTWS